jgi:hypothetical protein
MEHKPISSGPIKAAPPIGLRRRLSYMLAALDAGVIAIALVTASLIWHGSLYRTPEASLALALAYFAFALSNGAYAGTIYGIARPELSQRSYAFGDAVLHVGFYYLFE